MEQIVLYLAVLAALSGFGMGLMNIAGPFLKRRDFKLPALRLDSLLRRFRTDAQNKRLTFDFDASRLKPTEVAHVLAHAGIPVARRVDPLAA